MIAQFTRLASPSAPRSGLTGSLRLPALLAVWAFLAPTPNSQAEVPEPDNVLYGSITLDNVPVTADRTDVVIEARRTLNDPPIARYRMGSEDRFGNFYSLRLKVEANLTNADPDTSVIGNSIVIVLLDNSGIRGETTYQLPERGHVQRVDFGAAVSDADGNGLPDLWELTFLGAAGQDPNLDPDKDGQSTGQEFTAGTNPSDGADSFGIEMVHSGTLRFVVLPTRRAEGPGYEGFVRRYSLETTTNLLVAPWTGIPVFSDVIGDDQVHMYFVTEESAHSFYRARVTLGPP